MKQYFLLKISNMRKDKWIDLKDLLYILKQPKALQKDLINECSFSKDKIDKDTIVYESKHAILCE